MKSVFTAVFAAFLMMGMSPLALASDSAKEAKDSFAAAADETGDGFKEGVEFGPLNNIMQFNKVKGIVEDAKKDGARIVTGGQPMPGSSGYFYEPTIIADVSRAFPSWNLGPY